MSFQTGTLNNINDVLRTLRVFLLANGWTVDVDFREPLLMSVLNNHPAPGFTTQTWRWAQMLGMSKGTKHFVAQDFYIMHDLNFGTNGGTFPKVGPGIAICIGTAATPLATPEDETYWGGIHPAWYRHYTLAGDGVTPIYQQDTQGPNQFASFNGRLANPSPSMVMPLPAVWTQESGSWSNADFYWVNGYPNNDTELPAPFGPLGGSTGVPMKYWLMCDATGDNWAMVCLHDTTTTAKTTFMCMGDLVKTGPWVGGAYVGTSHSTANAFTGADFAGHAINRFGPPASVVDDNGMNFAVRMTVDSSPAAWVGIGAGARRLTSSAQIAGPFGLRTGSVDYTVLKTRRSSLNDGAPCLPPYLFVQRDSGLLSMVGVPPNLYQANTTGFAPGTEWTDGAGVTYVVFDGFAIRKVP